MPNPKDFAANIIDDDKRGARTEPVKFGEWVRVVREWNSCAVSVSIHDYPLYPKQVNDLISNLYLANVFVSSVKLELEGLL
jgi:hypothetical protein